MRKKVSVRPTRHLEWWLARFTCLFGLWILFIPDSMSSLRYQVAVHWMSPLGWGTAAVVVGVIHWTALLINGRWEWSPVVRAVAAAINTMFFAILGVGLLKQDVASVTAMIYSIGLTWAGLTTFAIAFRDSVYLYCHKRAEKSSG